MSKLPFLPPGKIIESICRVVGKENGEKETKEGVVSSTLKKGEQEPSEKDSEVVIL